LRRPDANIMIVLGSNDRRMLTMPSSPAAAPGPVRVELMQRVRAIASRCAERAAAAEEARRIPAESARELVESGLARILMPARFGGYALDFETWYDSILEISKADASHGWCASLIVHHAHLVAQFPEEAQQAVWTNGPDVAIAASFAPRAQAKRVDGGYRISGQDSSFASGLDHSSWLMVGAMVHESAGPDWVLFLIPRSECSVRDTWFTAGMRGTGSNTIVTDDVFVPAGRALRLVDLRQGQGPGGAIHKNASLRTPFFFYAPLTFAAPMLGAAQGAYAHFREGTKTRKAVDGSPVAQKVSTQVGMARAAADLDAAELLLRRATHASDAPEAVWPEMLARSVRDFARASELTVAAIDALIGLSGTAGFASSHPVQRAWRDIHFASTHISLNTEANYAHFGRMQFGLPRDPSRPFF
jgi:alkylation response protein AidB-like acyl-CoA dehydrogenase